MKKEQIYAFLAGVVLTLVALFLLFMWGRPLLLPDAATTPHPELDQPVPVGPETPRPRTDSAREKSPWFYLILLLLIIGIVAVLWRQASSRANFERWEDPVVRASDRFWRWLQGRQAPSPAPGKPSLLHDYKHEVAPGVWEGETTPPAQQFVTTYQLGDDRYDPSMSLEERGEFLGECGVGLAKWMHKEQVHLVPAFEVWLFDKMDIETHTAILASEAAARDPEARATLPDGAAVTVAGKGAGIVLQAKALRLRARVVEMAYLAHDQHSACFFERLKLEIAVWRRGISDYGF